MATEKAKLVYDGGNAFPVPTLDCLENGLGGMSLRDYFAAKAMQGLCANPAAWDAMRWEQIVTQSFDLADRMIGARDNPTA